MQGSGEGSGSKSHILALQVLENRGNLRQTLYSIGACLYMVRTRVLTGCSLVAFPRSIQADDSPIPIG